MNSFIIVACNVVAFSGVLILMYVGRQAQNDLHLSRTDPLWVQRYRKNSFFTGSLYLTGVILTQEYWLIHPTVIAVGIGFIGLILSSMYILSASILSMSLRVPPNRYEKQADTMWEFVRRKIHSMFYIIGNR